MERSRLEAMTLEALRAHAAERGIADAPSLDRAALLAALTAAAPPPATVSGSPVGRPLDHDTETMARLYFQQGLPDRAAEIYRKLLAITPDDTRLVSRLAEAEAAILVARGGGKLPEPPAREPKAAPAAEDAPVPVPDQRTGPARLGVPTPAPGEPFGMLDLEELPEAYGVDECELFARDPFHLFAYWEVTDSGLADARRHLGDEAEAAKLILRVFTRPGNDTRDLPLEQHRGRRYLPAPRPGVVVRAAVGLVAASGLFAPIAQSSTVRVPPAEPAPPTEARPEWMEVEPTRGLSVERTPIKIVPGAASDGHAERPLTSPQPSETTGESGGPGWPSSRGGR
jgi:uncharacterized protein